MVLKFINLLAYLKDYLYDKMVQKKVTQKGKAKTTPATSPKSLKSANNPKSIPLTNGYKNSKSQKAKKKAATETNSSESTKTVVNSSEVSNNKTSESNSFDSNATQQTEAGSSKNSEIVEAVSKANIEESSSNDKPSTSDNIESASSTESVPKKPKSVKRKIPVDDAVKSNKKITVNKTKAKRQKNNAEPGLNTASVSKNPKSVKRKFSLVDEAKTDINETLSNNQSGDKKQKIQLEIPSLKSIPGKVFVVGENDVGQLGLDEETAYKKRPSLLDLPYSIVDVAAGGMHSVCLTENGEVLTFGCNDEGALGRVTENEEEIYIPSKVEIPERVVKICCGDSHSAALTESGQVYVWGNFRNSAGPMGLITNGVNSITPIRILTRITVVKIASGEDHLVCLSNDGIVYTCGCGELGQLGRLNSRACTDGGRKGLAALLEPAPVASLVSKVPVDDVWTENCATFIKARKDGSIYAFGLNNYSQLGLQKTSNENDKQVKFFPEKVSSFNDKKWQQIIGGQHHTLALDSNGVVHCLGRKDYGRLGLGENCEDAPVPTVVPTLQNEKCNSVSCGNCVSFAVTEQGSLYSWGMGSYQLGQGHDKDVSTPNLVEGELFNSWEVYKVAGGGQHALILACPKKGNKKTAKES